MRCKRCNGQMFPDIDGRSCLTCGNVEYSQYSFLPPAPKYPNRIPSYSPRANTGLSYGYGIKERLISDG